MQKFCRAPSLLTFIFLSMVSQDCNLGMKVFSLYVLNPKPCMFTEIPKEKGTLKLPIEEIEIERHPPPYCPPALTSLPFDLPSRPALIFDLNGVLCVPWDSLSITSVVPDLEATQFQKLQESEGRLTELFLRDE